MRYHSFLWIPTNIQNHLHEYSASESKCRRVVETSHMISCVFSSRSLSAKSPLEVARLQLIWGHRDGIIYTVEWRVWYIGACVSASESQSLLLCYLYVWDTQFPFFVWINILSGACVTPATILQALHAFGTILHREMAPIVWNIRLFRIKDEKQDFLQMQFFSF